MMDLEYFKEQIDDELDGGEDYIKLAMETKACHPDWSRTLVSMSSQELGHATDLFRMYEEYQKTLDDAYPDGLPDWISDMQKCITDMYTKRSAMIKYMHEMYKK